MCFLKRWWYRKKNIWTKTLQVAISMLGEHPSGYNSLIFWHSSCLKTVQWFPIVYLLTARNKSSTREHLKLRFCDDRKVLGKVSERFVQLHPADTDHATNSQLMTSLFQLGNCALDKWTTHLLLWRSRCALGAHSAVELPALSGLASQ